jgi:Flp pilus assembly protein TadG
VTARDADRRHSSPGQATVELALCLPVVCSLLLGVVQVAVVVADQLAVQLAAREGARAAAVAFDAVGAASAAAHTATSLRPLTVEVRVRAATVTVTVRHTASTDVPLIGGLVGDVDLSASATMALEPP